MSNEPEAIESTPQKRRGRGPGKRPALVVTSLRLPKEVMEYFNTHFPSKKQAKMREVLSNFIMEQGAQNEKV
jgi:uncharacterized protein (DUF4415 family)